MTVQRMDSAFRSNAITPMGRNIPLWQNVILSLSPVTKQIPLSLLSKPDPMHTQVVFSHNSISFSQPRWEMNWKYIVSGGLLLVFAGIPS